MSRLLIIFALFVLVSKNFVLCYNRFKRTSEPLEEWDTLEGQMEPGIEMILDIFAEVKEGNETIKWKSVTDTLENELYPQLQMFVLEQRILPFLQPVDRFAMPEYCSGYTTEELQAILMKHFSLGPTPDMSVKLATCTMIHARLAHLSPSDPTKQEILLVEDTPPEGVENHDGSNEALD